MKYEFDSALGTTPVCDVCGKEVVLGDKVVQIFVGIVVPTHPDEGELGIREESYSLVHVDCQKRMN